MHAAFEDTQRIVLLMAQKEDKRPEKISDAGQGKYLNEA